MRTLGKALFRRIRRFQKTVPYFWAFFLAFTGLSFVATQTTLTSHRLQHVLTSTTTPEDAADFDSPCPLCASFVAQTPILEVSVEEAPFTEAITGLESVSARTLFPKTAVAPCARGPPCV